MSRFSPVYSLSTSYLELIRVNRENMEGRAHSSKSYTSQNSASRMMQDLSVCSEKFARHSEQQSATQVTNKPATGTEKRQNLHVGIIGAGLAGLRCAEILVEKGIKTTIIEARDRLGGRVSSSWIFT